MSSSGCLRQLSNGCLQAFITAVEALALNRSSAVYQLLPPGGLAANAPLSRFFVATASYRRRSRMSCRN